MATRVVAADGARPLVILPGFGNNTQDYTCPFGKEENALKTLLERRGWKVSVVELERNDWWHVALCIFTWAFWSNSCKTHPGYTWYLDRVQDTVQKALEESGAEQVDLVGHSVGGWLARAFVAQPRYWKGGDCTELAPSPAVNTVVCLGSPQGVPSSIRDMTGGTLRWVDSTLPGAYFRDRGVNYIAVAGSCVRGDASAEKGSLPRSAAFCYSNVCGQGDKLDGDCIVPVDYAVLAGAENLVLDGVAHSMSKVGSYTTPGDLPWYGSDDVMDRWLRALPAAQEVKQAAA